MPRLIEIQDVRSCPPTIRIASGDVLLIHAAGCRIRSGGEGLEVLGVFVQGIVGDDGTILTPTGPPNTILVRGQRAGDALLDVITGDPFYSPVSTPLRVVVR